MGGLQYLIGNADTHAKNISLLLTPPNPRLAPFYDLMSTAVYPELNRRLAMKIGGEDRPDWLMARHWQRFAAETGIGFKLVRRTLREMSETLGKQAAAHAAGFQRRHGRSDIVEWIVDTIGARRVRLTRRLADGETRHGTTSISRTLEHLFGPQKGLPNPKMAVIQDLNLLLSNSYHGPTPFSAVLLAFKR